MSQIKTIEFQYKFMFQTTAVVFRIEEDDAEINLNCVAKISLPVLKKEARWTTKYSRAQESWLKHSPLHSPESSPSVYENPNGEKKDFMDPLSFFLSIEEGRWNGERVEIFLGKKNVTLNTQKKNAEIILTLPEKNQTLYVGTSPRGIEYFKTKIPILGEIILQRKS